MSSVVCLLAEDISPTARGVRADLRDAGIEVLKTVESIEELIGAVSANDAYRRENRLVLVVDLGINGVCRYETIGKLSGTLQPCPPMVAVSGEMHTADGIWSLSSGAFASWDKDEGAEALVTAITRAGEREVTLRPKEAQWFLNRDDSLFAERRGDRRLRPSESELLGEIAEGVVTTGGLGRARLDELFAARTGWYLTPAERKAIIASAVYLTHAEASKRAGYKGTSTLTDHLNSAAKKLFPKPGPCSDEMDDEERQAAAATRVKGWAHSSHIHCKLPNEEHVLKVP